MPTFRFQLTLYFDDSLSPPELKLSSSVPTIRNRILMAKVGIRPLSGSLQPFELSCYATACRIARQAIFFPRVYNFFLIFAHLWGFGVGVLDWVFGFGVFS